MSKLDAIIKHIPDWMAIKNNPNSNGQKFLSTFGLELDDVNDVLEELSNSLYISKANVAIPDYVYQISLEELYEYTETLIVESSLPMVESIYALFKSTVPTGMFDFYKKMFYINNYVHNSDIFISVFSAESDVNGQPVYDSNNNYIKDRSILTKTSKAVSHHIWNCFDEFALLLGISRLPYEENEGIRDRIVSAVASPSGSNDSGLKAAITRDLGLDPVTVQIKGLSDVEVYNNKNQISSEFTTYLKELQNVQTLITPKWDTEMIDESILSIDYMPRLYSNILSFIKPEDIQSGIGDLDDLLIEAPGKVSDTQNFDAYIGLTAEKSLTTDVYPKHNFQVVVDAVGSISKEIHAPKDIAFSVVASENKLVNFKVEANQNYANDLVIPSSIVQTALVVLDGGDVSQTLACKSSSVDFVPSNTLFHYNESIIRMFLDLYSSNDKVFAPTISNMKINYARNDGSIGSMVVDLTRAEDNVDNDSGEQSLTIRKGQYYHEVQYREDFLNGGSTDDQIITGTTTGIYLPAFE